jgi:hypothetical protein
MAVPTVRKTKCGLSLQEREFFEKNRPSTRVYGCNPFETKDFQMSKVVHVLLSPKKSQTLRESTFFPGALGKATIAAR